MSISDVDTPVKVLLIEDDEDDAIITQALLGKSSSPRFEIDWAPSFEAGLTHIEAQQHDIGLIDYNLGNRTGIEFLQAAQTATSHPPMIMLTGQGNETLVLQALELGAIDYLPKRLISLENLQRTICHGIEKMRLQANIAAHQRQLERTNRELQQRTEEIQRFYHLLAHELKTPLSAASEFVNILLETIPGPINAEQIHYLQLIQGCCGHLNRNINDLYEITRLETGKLSLNRQSANLTSLIQDVLQYFLPQAQEKHITLDCQLTTPLPHAHIDAQRIRQVLLNLVGNALKFTDPHGKIVVQAHEDPVCLDRIRISIVDTGKGIPASQLTGIFERLYQVEKDPSSASPGLGLGLFICRELIKLHEGTLSVTSTVGQGSTFSFTLPCRG